MEFYIAHLGPTEDFTININSLEELIKFQEELDKNITLKIYKNPRTNEKKICYRCR